MCCIVGADIRLSLAPCKGLLGCPLIEMRVIVRCIWHAVQLACEVDCKLA